MNSPASKSILALGVALTLGLCASLPGLASGPAGFGSDQFAPIQLGLTQDAVRAVAGTPPTVTTTPEHQTMWVYPYRDSWGQRSEFEVTFDAGGHVTRVFGLRLAY